MPAAYINENGERVKLCLGCRVILPADRFGKSTKDGSDGLRVRCKPCVNADSRARSASNPDMVRRHYEQKLANGTFARSGRRHRFKVKYGLTPEQVDAMKLAAGYRCEICGKDLSDEKPRATLNVDHCHKTGKIRGVLCPNCNRAIGLFGDNVDAMANAILYLKRHDTR